MDEEKVRDFNLGMDAINLFVKLQQMDAARLQATLDRKPRHIRSSASTWAGAIADAAALLRTDLATTISMYSGNMPPELVSVLDGLQRGSEMNLDKDRSLFVDKIGGSALPPTTVLALAVNAHQLHLKRFEDLANRLYDNDAAGELMLDELLPSMTDGQRELLRNIHEQGKTAER